MKTLDTHRQTQHRTPFTQLRRKLYFSFPSDQFRLAIYVPVEVATDSMDTKLTSSTVLTPRLPRMQSFVASNIEPENITATTQDLSVQQEGGSPGSSEDSFTSAEETLASNQVAQLILERDDLRKELDASRRQLEAARRDSAALERQVRDLHLKISAGAKDLKLQVTELTAKVRYHESGRAKTYQNGVMDGMRSHVSTNERMILLQQVEAYKSEAAKWRMEAFRQGSDAISQCWQASVDEAVRREREKDALVMKVLRDEIAALKSKKEG